MILFFVFKLILKAKSTEITLYFFSLFSLDFIFRKFKTKLKWKCIINFTLGENNTEIVKINFVINSSDKMCVMIF